MSQGKSREMSRLFSFMSFNVINLTFKRDRRNVLSNVDLSLLPGELVGLLGANGAGKSTLLAAMAGELRGQTDSVQIGAVSVERLSALEQAQRRVVVTQQSSLTFDLRVREVLQMGAYPYPQASVEQVEHWLNRSLALTELLSLQGQKYTELSGGEQQRVQLARALVQCFAIEHYQGTAYLLLDEPLANLDPRHQIEFMHVIEELVCSGRIGVLMVLHDLNVAARHCQRLVLLDEGRVIANGPPAQVLTTEALKQAFGVDWAVVPHPEHANRLLVLT